MTDEEYNEIYSAVYRLCREEGDSPYWAAVEARAVAEREAEEEYYRPNQGPAG